MNYLAHLYLSGDNDDIKIGNFIADAVKGSSYNDYSNEVRFGILLHRKIDSFTDSNKIVQRCTARLRPAYGKFSGAAVDVLFDHFLASLWNDYSDVSLREFADKSYQLLEKNISQMPPKLQEFSPFFIKRDRLNCYANIKCFEDVLLKMGIYTPLPAKSKAGMKIIKAEYDNFKDDFRLFFEEIKEYVNGIMVLKDAEPKDVINF